MTKALRVAGRFQPCRASGRAGMRLCGNGRAEMVGRRADDGSALQARTHGPLYACAAVVGLDGRSTKSAVHPLTLPLDAMDARWPLPRAPDDTLVHTLPPRSRVPPSSARGAPCCTHAEEGDKDGRWPIQLLGPCCAPAAQPPSQSAVFWSPSSSPRPVVACHARRVHCRSHRCTGLVLSCNAAEPPRPGHVMLRWRPASFAVTRRQAGPAAPPRNAATAAGTAPRTCRPFAPGARPPVEAPAPCTHRPAKPRPVRSAGAVTPGQ